MAISSCRIQSLTGPAQAGFLLTVNPTDTRQRIVSSSALQNFCSGRPPAAKPTKRRFREPQNEGADMPDLGITVSAHFCAHTIC